MTKPTAKPAPPGAPPADPPRARIRWVRTREEAAALRSAEGARAQVRCGNCGKRAFDLTVVRMPAQGYLGVPGIPRDSMERRSAEAAMVGRECPGCGHHATCPVTLYPGHPVLGAIDGPWRCASCRVSLGRVDARAGSVKATCWKCGATVKERAGRVFCAEPAEPDGGRAPV